MAGLIGALVGSTVGRLDSKKMPNTDKVEQGYVVPSKLEIQVRDLDDSGSMKTIVRYDNTNYLFKVDTNGIPIATPYKIKPKQIKLEN